MYLHVIHICQYVCSILGFSSFIYLHSSSRVFRTGMLQFSPPYKNFVPKFQYSHCVGIQLTFPLCRAFRCLSRSSVSRFSLSSVSSDHVSICKYYMPIYHLRYYNDFTMQHFHARVISLGSDTTL